ncbi:MAG: hypothetical protein ACOY30_04850 [Bacillota bacterium]
MFRRLDNDRGIALLTVMVIMTVLVITGSLLLRMASSESRIIYSFGNNMRAFYIAEAGADLAIKQWQTYISTLALVDGDGQPTAVKANIDNFKTGYLDSSNLTDKIKNGYSLGSGSSKVSIVFESPSEPTGGDLDKILPDTPDPKPMLTMRVTGTYDDASFEQKVSLWYYWNGDNGSYKGYVTPDPDDAPAIPPPGGGGGDPPPYHPPASPGDWTVLTGGGGNQWSFDPITGTISREQESIHVFLYSNNPVSAPFSLDMYVSFFNLHKDWNKWIGSSAGVGFGYDPWGIPHYTAYFSIINVSNSPRVMVNIFDQNLALVSGPYTFSQIMDENSQYRLKVTAKTNDLKIEVSNGGETLTYTTTTTLRTGSILLNDLTNSHVDPKFTFPP